MPRAPGSVLFSSQSGPWQLHACTLAEVKAVTSEGTVKSQPALHDVGVLPTITQMFPISWVSPLLLLAAINNHCILLEWDIKIIIILMIWLIETWADRFSESTKLPLASWLTNEQMISFVFAHVSSPFFRFKCLVNAVSVRHSRKHRMRSRCSPQGRPFPK